MKVQQTLLPDRKNIGQHDAVGQTILQKRVYEMSKQELSHSTSSGNSQDGAIKEGRYYVQNLTDHIFLVRECRASDGKPGSDDPIIRSFDVRYDAYNYANSMNA